MAKLEELDIDRQVAQLEQLLRISQDQSKPATAYS